jgi:hypothetical protein
MDGFVATFKYQGPSNLQKSRRSRVEHGMTRVVRDDEAQEEVYEL